MVAILFNLGFRQMNLARPAARSIKVVLVQPSIPQTLIWDASKSAERFDDLIQLSEQALTNQAELMIKRRLKRLAAWHAATISG